MCENSSLVLEKGQTFPQTISFSFPTTGKEEEIVGTFNLNDYVNSGADYIYPVCELHETDSIVLRVTDLFVKKEHSDIDGRTEKEITTIYT